MIYTGVGSRKTPMYVCELMVDFARRAAARGWILRSGACPIGADAAFEAGVDATPEQDHLKEIYWPWPEFRDDVTTRKEFLQPTAAAYDMAATIHPKWKTLSRGEKALHARNCHQVLGLDLTRPSDFLICWTPGGQLQGGTATAIRLAMRNDITIFNLAKGNAEQTIEYILGTR